VLAIVSPGQGSQSPQMLAGWLVDPQAKKVIDAFSNFVGLDLIDLGVNAPAELIKQTELSQPLIVAASLLSWEMLEVTSSTMSDENIVFAGHSVGEFAAARAANSIDNQTALELVKARGSAMAQAAANSPETGMSAVLGGDKNLVIQEIQNIGLVAANVNANGQIVAAGDKSSLEELAENPPSGTRIRPLDVSAAFHTHYMTEAKNNLKSFFDSKTFQDPQFNIISNTDGVLVKDSDDLKGRLLSQIDSPVRWDLCQDTFKKLKITGLLELAPGGVLTGIAKRELPDVDLLAIKTIADIPAAKEFISMHLGAN
jgi:[acyl-carrier-protein] S-malonyltransferase